MLVGYTILQLVGGTFLMLVVGGTNLMLAGGRIWTLAVVGGTL